MRQKKQTQPLADFVADIAAKYDKGFETRGSYRGDIFYSDLQNRMKAEYGKYPTIDFQLACRMLEAKHIFVHS